MSSLLRKTAWTASALAIVAACGCSRMDLQDMTPPPSAYVDVPPPPPYERPRSTELLGGPGPNRPAYRPAPPPPPRQNYGPQYGVMAPIPNPEDMNPMDRARVYGDQEVATARDERGPSNDTAQTRPLRQERRADAARQDAAPAAMATRDQSSRSPAGPARPDKRQPDVARPTAQAAAPAAGSPAASTPARQAQAAAPAKPTTPQTKAERLGAAVAQDFAAKSKLELPPAIAAGEEGVVTLTVPAGLLDRIRAQAEKVGLSVAARAVDMRAKLTGEGYVIVPDETQVAHLKENEPTSFSWQVTPGAGEKGPLKADVQGELTGAEKPVTFPFATISPDGVVDAATIPDAPLVTVPGLGHIRSGWIVLVGLAVLALIVLSALGRQARDRRRSAQRGQRARETHADFSPGSAGAKSAADNGAAPAAKASGEAPAASSTAEAPEKS